MSETPNGPGDLPPAPADAPDPGTPIYDQATQATQQDPAASAEIEQMTQPPPDAPES